MTRSTPGCSIRRAPPPRRNCAAGAGSTPSGRCWPGGWSRGYRARLLAAIQKDADGCIYRRFTQEEDFCPCGCRQLTEQLRLWVNDASKTMAGDVSKVYRSLTGQFSQFTKQNIQEPFGLSSSSAYAPQPVSIERTLSTPI